MSALLVLIRKARQAQAPRMSDLEAACRIAFLFDKVARFEHPDDLATVDELFKLFTLRHEDALDLLEIAGGTGGPPASEE